MVTLQDSFDNFAHQVGLCGEKGEHPTVVFVSPDPDSTTAQIITVQGRGISLPLPVALDNKIRLLEYHLGGEVYDISFGETTTQARFKFKPKEEG